MVTRLYANNFRCLVAFQAEFESFGVLCGPNGSGKSSVLDALGLIRNLATGDGFLGGEGERDIPSLEFCNWLNSTSQEFELEMIAKGEEFRYVIHLEQKAAFEKPRITKELASCNGKSLFERNLDGVRIMDGSKVKAQFPLDWRQAALASIQAVGPLKNIQSLKDAIGRFLILRPNPRAMERESRSESRNPDLSLGNLTSWYRSLAQEQDWTDALRELLQGIWPDFKSFRLMDVGSNTKSLLLRFDAVTESGKGNIYFHQLSDGEKALVGLYMIRAALDTGAVGTVLIDEPDNFVGLQELLPWVLSVRELLDEDHQAILITHHPEILNSVGDQSGQYLWREDHTSPTRVGPLTAPDGLTPGEAMGRGWVRG